MGHWHSKPIGRSTHTWEQPPLLITHSFSPGTHTHTQRRVKCQQREKGSDYTGRPIKRSKSESDRSSEKARGIAAIFEEKLGGCAANR